MVVAHCVRRRRSLDRRRFESCRGSPSCGLRLLSLVAGGPHPVMPPGSLFDAILQARPEAGLGRLTVCDPTLWTSTNGGVDGLEALWNNL
jgi:hypothetical protein